MANVQKGSKVKVHYTGTLSDGTVFDSSREREAMGFTVGEGRLLKGFEQGVVGMAVGNVRTVEIPAAEAYGERNEDIVRRLERSKFPPAINPEPGACLNLRQPDGGVLDVVVTEVNDEMVTLDANHPLAGQDLTFEIEVIEIEG